MNLAQTQEMLDYLLTQELVFKELVNGKHRYGIAAKGTKYLINIYNTLCLDTAEYFNIDDKSDEFKGLGIVIDNFLKEYHENSRMAMLIYLHEDSNHIKTLLQSIIDGIEETYKLDKKIFN